MDAKLLALSKPRRIEILRILRRGELAAGQIARRFSVTRPAVSQHLRILTNAGLIVERREGTYRFYRVDPVGLLQLHQLVEEFWDGGLARLKVAAERAELKGEGRRGQRKRRARRLPRTAR